MFNAAVGRKRTKEKEKRSKIIRVITKSVRMAKFASRTVHRLCPLKYVLPAFCTAFVLQGEYQGGVPPRMFYDFVTRDTVIKYTLISGQSINTDHSTGEQCC